MPNPPRDIPAVTYCTPEEVFETIEYFDHDTQKLIIPSNTTVPTAETLRKRILAMEDQIDLYTGDTWRVKKVEGQIVEVDDYWKDGNSWARSDYFKQGGFRVNLHKNVLPWDPEKGDKLEIRSRLTTMSWADITCNVQRSPNDTERAGVRFDYNSGLMYIRGGLFLSAPSEVRITYRYGREGPVPYDINRCCSLMVGLTVLTTDYYRTKVGVGGDLGGSFSEKKKWMQEEINNILTARQIPTTVYSALE